jgi:hypothetical protein
MEIIRQEKKKKENKIQRGFLFSIVGYSKRLLCYIYSLKLSLHDDSSQCDEPVKEAGKKSHYT